MSKKVLIVCKYFAPENSIASIRPTKIGKYLNKSGYTVDVVVTSPNVNFVDETLSIDLKFFNNIYRMSVINIQKKTSIFFYTSRKIFFKLTKFKFLNFFFKSFKSHLVYILFLLEDYIIVKRFKKLNISLLDYDIVFSTYAPHSSHYIGRIIKKINPKIKWIADFRDPVYQKSVPYLFKGFAKRFVKKVCIDANIITSASTESIKDLYLTNKFIAKTIYNGYDKFDYKFMDINENYEEKFVLCYTGTIYEGKQDYGPIFQAISELSLENKIDIKKIVFLYAGKDFQLLFKMAKKFNVEEILVDNGYVSRANSLQIQSTSDLLVIGAWKNETENMSLAGKFFEYIQFNRPILGIVSGNRGDSELREIIRKSELGFCYEEAYSRLNYTLMKEFLIETYKKRFISNRNLSTNIQNKNQEYSYLYITNDLINIIKKIELK